MRAVALCVLVLAAAVSAHKVDLRQKKTAPRRCIAPSPCFPSRQTIAQFAANMTGQVLQPSDAGYAAAVNYYNQRVVGNPAIVVMAANEQDVQHAVLFARKYYLMLVVCEGNGYNDGVYNADGAFQINMNNMEAVSTSVDLTSSVVDPGTVTAQPGATWNEVYQAAENTGRTLVGPGYFDFRKPIALALMAAGNGPTSKLFGLISDSVISARVVTMDGSVVEVSAAGASMSFLNGIQRFTTLDPGLWQAVRGGGALSFGIPTSFTLALKVPTVNYFTHVSMIFPLYVNQQFVGRESLKAVLPQVAALPEEWGAQVLVTGLPSETTVGVKGEFHVELWHFGVANSASYNAVNTLLAYNGNNTRLSLRVENRTRVEDAFNAIGFRGFLATDQRFYTFNTLAGDDAISDPAKLDHMVDALLSLLNNPTVDSHYLCSLEYMGGMVRGENMTGAVPRAVRHAGVSVTCGIRWNDNDGARDAVMINYTLKLKHKFAALGNETNLMYRGFFEDLSGDWKYQMYGENYAELLRVKRKYDIDNFLWCHNCVASDFNFRCPRGRCDAMKMLYGESMEESKEESEESEDGMGGSYPDGEGGDGDSMRTAMGIVNMRM